MGITVSMDKTKMRLEINIAIIGQVSVGKSTFVNSLFINQFSDTKLKRTTMVPQVYVECTNSTDFIGANRIRDINRLRNAEVHINIEALKNGKKMETMTEIMYRVLRIPDFVTRPEEICFTIYDIPGINDEKTVDACYKYLDDTFYKFDLIIFILDINTAMNTESEAAIFKKIVALIHKNKKNSINTKMIILLNKCDDMYISDGKITMDEDYIEMYEQALKVFREYASDIDYEVVRVSLEDAYIYRMVHYGKGDHLDMKHINKLGYNDLGKRQWNRLRSDKQRRIKFKEIAGSEPYSEAMKMSGFTHLNDTLNSFLTPENQYRYICNHIIYSMNCILETMNNIHEKSTCHTCFEQSTDLYEQILDQIKLIYKLYPNIKKQLKSNYNVSLRTCMEIYHKKLEYDANINNKKYVVSDDTISAIELFKITVKRIMLKISGTSYMLHPGLALANIKTSTYYTHKLADPKLSQKDAYSYIDKLIKDEYKDWKMGLLDHIINADYFIDRETAYCCLRKLHDIYPLPSIHRIQHAFIILNRLYHQKVDDVYSYKIQMFWKRVHHYPNVIDTSHDSPEYLLYYLQRRVSCLIFQTSLVYESEATMYTWIKEGTHVNIEFDYKLEEYFVRMMLEYYGDTAPFTYRC